MKSALLLLLFPLSCGHQTAPDYVTAHGLHFYTNGTAEQRKEVEYVTESLIQEFSQEPGYTESKIRGVLWRNEFTVKVSRNPIPCVGTEGECAGTFVGRAIQYKYERCLPMSAYLHELVHLLQLWVTGRYDPNHENREIWTDRSSVLIRTALRTCEELCPLLCPSRLPSGELALLTKNYTD